MAREPTTRRAQAAFEEDPQIIVWWGTEVECLSAVARHERERTLSARAVTHALERLDALIQVWSEVEPVEAVRRTAKRLLRVHPLRAADALQLAAAIEASEGHPAQLPIISLDDRLIDAAQREGFAVVDLART